MDQSTDWAPLHLIKESNPIEVAEFALAHNFDKEPAFQWWVKKVVKKRDHVIAKVKSRCYKPN